MKNFQKSYIFFVKYDLVIVFSSSNAVNVIVIYVVEFKHKKYLLHNKGKKGGKTYRFILKFL